MLGLSLRSGRGTVGVGPEPARDRLAVRGTGQGIGWSSESRNQGPSTLPCRRRAHQADRGEQPEQREGVLRPGAEAVGQGDRGVPAHLRVEVARLVLPGLRQDIAVRVDDRRDAGGGGLHGPAAVLDGPEAGDRQLLVGLAGAHVGGVVAGDQQDLAAALDRVADHVVVGDLEDDGGDGDPAESQHALAVAGDEVARDHGEPLDHLGQDAAEGQVLAEGHQVGLVVDGAHPAAGARRPDDQPVQHVGARGIGVDHRADQHRDADVVDGLLDLRGDAGIGVGVHVRAVLRPHHQVRLDRLARADVGGQDLGLLDVVVQDRGLLLVPAEADARDVALDQRDAHRRAGVRGLRRHAQAPRRGSPGCRPPAPRPI